MALSVQSIRCIKCGKSINIQIWPETGYISTEDCAHFEINTLSNGEQTVDIYCDECYDRLYHTGKWDF